MDYPAETGKKDLNLYILAWTVVGGFFALCAILMEVSLPEGSSQIVYLLFGGLVTGFTQVLGYFFGSYKSSNDKTKLLAWPGK
jgi:lipopolysaccharide export LptBFGC system permease protein LptF